MQMGTKIIIPNYELLEQIGESPQANLLMI